MKEHAKKALKHDVSVAGKTIPTLLLVGLFLVGGGSAALLTSFGTVSGTADVHQAIEVDDQSGQASLNYFGGDGIDVVAGETKVSGPYTVTNNMDSAFEPSVTTELSRETSGDSFTEVQTVDNTGNDNFDVDWTYTKNSGSFDGVSSNDQVGIQTTYVNAFHSAGHNFSAVSATRNSADVVVDPTDADTPDTISEGINALGENEGTVFVAQRDSGSYSGFTLDKAGVSVVSNGAKVKGNIEIAADNFRLSGFEVVDAENSANNDIIRVQTNSVDSGEISNLLINGKGKDDTGTGIYLNHFNAASNLVIKHNTIKNAWAGIGGTESFEGSINYNVFKSNDEAIGVGDDEFSTEGNRFENNVASFRVYTGKYSSSSSSVDASGNFFHEPFNIDYNGNEGVTDVSASYMTLGDFKIDAESTMSFGVVHEFSPYLTSDSFKLETTIGDSSS